MKYQVPLGNFLNFFGMGRLVFHLIQQHTIIANRIIDFDIFSLIEVKEQEREKAVISFFQNIIFKEIYSCMRI